MVLWCHEIDAFISVHPLSTSSFLPLVYQSSTGDMWHSVRDYEKLEKIDFVLNETTTAPGASPASLKLSLPNYFMPILAMLPN